MQVEEQRVDRPLARRVPVTAERTNGIESDPVERSRNAKVGGSGVGPPELGLPCDFVRSQRELAPNGAEKSGGIIGMAL